MNVKVKSKAGVCVLISLLSLVLLVICGMAMLGGEFFSWVGRAFHYIYYFLAVREFNYETWIGIAIGAVAIIAAIYWLVIIFKSENVEAYELVAPFTSLLMPFVVLAAYRGIALGIWARDEKVLVIISLVALAIYVVTTICSYIFAFVSSKKKRSAAKRTVVIVEKAPEPVVEEVVEEVKEEKVPEVVVADVPNTPNAPKKKVVRKPFAEKMAKASGEIKDTYNILKNELLSYGVKSRISHGSDTFRLRKQEYAKITLVGKNLKLYVATNPKKYDGTTFPVRDEGSKKCFAETPTMIKVKSTLSVKRAKMMIADLMAERGLTQGEVESVNYARQLKAKKARTAKK